MTLLAGPLENGRHVFGKRRRWRGAGLRRSERGTSHEATERQCQTTDPPSMLSRHANLQEQCSRSLCAKITDTIQEISVQWYGAETVVETFAPIAGTAGAAERRTGQS
jgi:hypothetical protein